MTAGRRLLACLVALLALAAAAAPAAVAEYPPATEELAVTDTAPAPGDEILVTGGGFMPGSTVTLTFESTPVFLATALVDADGHFAVWVRIPLGASAGWHTIRARGIGVDGLPRELTIPIFVTGAAPVPRTAGVGDGGTAWSSLFRLGLWPACVFLVGANLWAFRRRRRARRASTATSAQTAAPEG